MVMAPTSDVCIVGGGIVGLATARAIVAGFPGATVTVLEKEPEVGVHQTGHNSGVLHSGLYYRPGSLKARLCVDGQRRMDEACAQLDVPLRRTGKIVVATKSEEIPALEELYRRGTANGLRDLEWLDPEDMRAVEPHVAGVRAIRVPEAGIVDFRQLARRMAAQLIGKGVDIETGAAVEAIEPGESTVAVATAATTIITRLVVNCAGLHADRVARLAGVEPPVRIVPFRGEYYSLGPNAEQLVRAMIYPVPDPRFPFLGVHFTRRIDGIVEAGPNAVLAMGREHYRGSKPDLGELARTIRYRGFRRLARRYWRTGLTEAAGSLSRRLYARRARLLLPEVRHEDLMRAGAGVRAQAVTPQGALVDDFVLETRGRMVHVLNAPSPAATASLAIGEHIATIAARSLERGT